MILAATLVASTSTSAAPGRFDTGIHNPAMPAGGQDFAALPPALAMAKVNAAGSRFVRIPVKWDRIVCGGRSEPCTRAGERPTDPTDPSSSEYRWTRGTHDSQIAAALAAGLEPMLVVHGVPAYAECDGNGNRPGTAGQLTCPGQPDRVDEMRYKPSPSEYAAFVTALSRQYPRVRYFEVWNEPNLWQFLEAGSPSETIARYRQMVNQAYGAIKALNRGDVLVAGATAATTRDKPFRVLSPRWFLRTLVSKRVKFDVYSMHPYTPGGPHTKAPYSSGSVWVGNLGQLNKILKQAERAGRIRSAWRVRFWVSEFSWDSAPPDCRRGEIVRDGVTYLLRAAPSALWTRWISEVSYRMWRQGVSALFWLQLKDFPAKLSAYQGGLYRWGGYSEIGRPKTGLQAFKFPFVAYKRHGSVFVWGRRPDASGGRIVIQARSGGSWRKVQVLRATKSGLFKRTIRLAQPGSSMRARTPGGTSSVPFRLKPPRVPLGIQPFGCTKRSQWKR